MLPSNFFDQLQEIYIKEDRGTQVFQSEAELLREALEIIAADIPQYELECPLGRGGSGIVIKVRDRRLDLPRALKMPRPKGDQILDSVKQEMSHLVKVRHQNIIALHTMNEVKVGNLIYPYFVMDYIEGARDLRKRLSTLIDEAAGRSSLGLITDWLAKRLLETARAVYFLHQNQIIHFDIKPANVLVDGTDRPIVSDLGFAKRQSDSDESVVVGFTLFYAHPDLATHYLSGSSQNRIRKQVSPKGFRSAWDIFAFGKSILELLALIDRDFPDAVSYDATFLSLHLAACRMLDGHNLPDDEINSLKLQQNRDGYLSYRETWMSLKREFREPGIRYDSMLQVVSDLEKLVGSNNIIVSVPELDPYFPHRIQCSGGMPAPFTKRVKKLVEHPVVARLATVPHLGLVRYIYPTATHTRLEHALGTFRNSTQYLLSLYQDPFNPFFRQVVDDADLKTVLIASLLHDIGHYPFAHELEEVTSELKHERLTLALLGSTARDVDGHTLRDIIENRDWGWGVPLEQVHDVLADAHKTKPAQTLFPVSSLKLRMLSSIVDGPLDVDKLDYLTRDSSECRLPYGQLIDQDRLIRNLTMVFSNIG